jgi:hypothetical protein
MLRPVVTDERLAEYDARLQTRGYRLGISTTPRSATGRSNGDGRGSYHTIASTYDPYVLPPHLDRYFREDSLLRSYAFAGASSRLRSPNCCAFARR